MARPGMSNDALRALEDLGVLQRIDALRAALEEHDRLSIPGGRDFVARHIVQHVRSLLAEIDAARSTLDAISADAQKEEER